VTIGLVEYNVQIAINHDPSGTVEVAEINLWVSAQLKKSATVAKAEGDGHSAGPGSAGFVPQRETDARGVKPA
jgi:hypothetical protein